MPDQPQQKVWLRDSGRDLHGQKRLSVREELANRQGENRQQNIDPLRLPTPADREYVRSLMTPVYEPGKFANWISPPNKGVQGAPIDFEYVKLAR